MSGMTVQAPKLRLVSSAMVAAYPSSIFNPIPRQAWSSAAL